MKGNQVNYPITIIAVLMQFNFKCNFYNQQIGVVRVNHKTKFGIQLDILRIIITPLACNVQKLANNILNHNGKLCVTP